MKITFRDHYKSTCVMENYTKKTIALGIPNAVNFHNGRRWEVSKVKADNMSVYSSMILTKEQVKKILPALTRFAETGVF